MKLRLISEIQYKETSTNMIRKNLSSQYGATDFNDTLHSYNGDHRAKEKRHQQSLQAKYNKIKRQKLSN